MMSQSEALEKYKYDRKTGKVTRRKNIGRWKAGTEVGTKHKYGRTDTVLLRWKQCNGARPLTHLIWLMEKGAFPSPEVDIDHRNNDPLDNRWDNLREASRSENCINRRNWGKYPKGVSKTTDGKKFRARITVYDKTRMLGNYDTADEAHAAYNCAAGWAFGEWSYNA